MKYILAFLPSFEGDNKFLLAVAYQIKKKSTNRDSRIKRLHLCVDELSPSKSRQMAATEIQGSPKMVQSSGENAKDVIFVRILMRYDNF